MPKTAEEYEVEIKKLQADLANRDGQIAAISKEKDTAFAQVEAHSLKIKDMTDKVAKFEQAERTALETEVHSFVKEYDCKGKSNEYLQAFVEGFKSKNEPKKETNANAAVNAPPAEAPKNTASNSTNLTTGQKMLKSWGMN